MPTDADFAEFFTAAWPRLYRTAVAIAGDAAAAEDALQSAFARVYAAWRRVSSGPTTPRRTCGGWSSTRSSDGRRRGWWAS